MHVDGLVRIGLLLMQPNPSVRQLHEASKYSTIQREVYTPHKPTRRFYEASDGAEHAYCPT
jgi:hypothetical protein